MTVSQSGALIATDRYEMLTRCGLRPEDYGADHDDGGDDRDDQPATVRASGEIGKQTAVLVGAGRQPSFARRPPVGQPARLHARDVPVQAARSARSTSTVPRPKASTRPQRPGMSSSSRRPMPCGSAGSMIR